jgi:molybdate/tungstate transport system ATP-binding protein
MIRVQNLSVQLSGFRLANVCFEVPQGEYAVLMGKTGTGKTTILECLCGLRPIRSGQIWLGSQEVTQLPPSQRGIGYVPQDGALFAHMSVREHLTFPLEIRRWKRHDIDRRTRELSSLLALDHLLDRHPRWLSGGEAQRVALGRALSFEPAVLLLDEPLSALDSDSREQAYEVLARVQRLTHVTALHITHNFDESVRLANRTLRLVDGQVVTVSTRESTALS